MSTKTIAAPAPEDDSKGKKDEKRNLPENLEFFLNAKDEVMARFTAEEDGREFPLKHVIIQAELHKYLYLPSNAATKNKAGMDALMFRAVREASEKFRKKADRLDDNLEDDTLTLAILIRFKEDPKSVVGTQGKLREKLLSVAQTKELDTSDWKKNSHFGSQVMARRDVLKVNNVEASYHRKGMIREYTLKLIEPMPADPAPEHLQDGMPDLMADLEIAGKIVTPDDAKTEELPSSKTVTPDDAKTEELPSSAEKKKVIMVEVTGGKEAPEDEEGDLAERVVRAAE